MAKAELINLEKELKKRVAFNKLANNSNNMLFNDYFFQINGKIRLVSVIISKFYGQKKVYISTINKAVSENDTAYIKDVYFTDPKILTSQIKLNLGISVNESRQSKTLSKNALTLPGKMQGAASENYAIQQPKHISNIPQNCEKSSSSEGVIYGIIGRIEYFDEKKNKTVYESVNKNKINKICFYKDVNGNFAITVSKIDVSNLNNKNYKKVGVGVAPTIHKSLTYPTSTLSALVIPLNLTKFKESPSYF